MTQREKLEDVQAQLHSTGWGYNTDPNIAHLRDVLDTLLEVLIDGDRKP